MYGCAYDIVSDGGPFLWIFTGITGAGCQIEQYNLNTLSLTGVTHSVSDDFGAVIAGGLFTSGEIVLGEWILGGLAQVTNILFGYELCLYQNPPNVVFNPEYGTVSPFGGTETIEVSFYSYDDIPGTVHTGQVFFQSQQNVPTVPVSLCLSIIDTVSIDEIKEKPTILYDNFPNPVLNNTTFKFSLKEPSHVTLSIYNFKGQLVATLLDDELEPSASHYIEWESTAKGKKLANGIYFYKLITKDQSFIKKLILIR